MRSCKCAYSMTLGLAAKLEYCARHSLKIRHLQSVKTTFYSWSKTKGQQLQSRCYPLTPSFSSFPLSPLPSH